MSKTEEVQRSEESVMKEGIVHQKENGEDTILAEEVI